jgi:hypothetical protein
VAQVLLAAVKALTTLKASSAGATLKAAATLATLAKEEDELCADLLPDINQCGEC